MSTDPQPPRCKCGHGFVAHPLVRTDSGWSDGRCVVAGCGCLILRRPAETAR